MLKGKMAENKLQIINNRFNLLGLLGFMFII